MHFVSFLKLIVLEWPRNMSKRRAKLNPSLLRLGGLILLVMLLFITFGDQGLRRLYELSRLEKNFEQQVALLENENARLTVTIAHLNDRDNMERVVRNQMGYLRADEIVFYLARRGTRGPAIQQTPLTYGGTKPIMPLDSMDGTHYRPTVFKNDTL